MELITDKVFVLHVKKGYEDRAKHMEEMLAQRNISFQYMLDGDIADLTEERLDKYFFGEIKSPNPVASCACKHFLTYEAIIANDFAGALILEDDIFLNDNFVELFNKCIDELKNREDLDSKQALISFENTRLRFVPQSQLKEGRYLYRGNKDRMAGAYYITYATAKQIMEYVYQHKCDLPVDGLHGKLLAEENLPYYWCEPAVAEQGSHNGIFKSGISRNSRWFFFKKILWKGKLAYKKRLYRFR